jgi:hypothetical protein
MPATIRKPATGLCHSPLSWEITLISYLYNDCPIRIKFRENVYGIFFCPQSLLSDKSKGLKGHLCSLHRWVRCSGSRRRGRRTPDKVPPVDAAPVPCAFFRQPIRCLWRSPLGWSEATSRRDLQHLKNTN